MFNPLNFFKKKPVEPLSPLNEAAEPVEEKQSQFNDIAIHTMPERFRHEPVKADSAKTTGLLIIGGGVVFLIAASVLLYLYLFKKPTVTVKEETPIASVTPVSEQTQPEDNQAAPDLATTTEPAVLPADNALATSTATSTPETVEPELPVGLIFASDSDNDGLTDAEEMIFKTGTSTPDTDGDSYLDGAELSNLYNPAGAGKLATNTGIALYENKAFSYSALYPSAWPPTVNGGDDSIMFKTSDNQFFQIIVQPNANQETLDQWYIEQLDVAAINDLDRLSGSGWQGIKSLDGLTLYLTDAKQKYIFTLAYNPGEENVLSYINIFNMMIKSFTLK